ncbi:MAG: prepilin-type N-terminal cleavage/methylation domain-containing protein [Candidatus Omnitrophica bacterium]|nr:prepilin-type N-terminal cleavage/methylation domain-containing protein [Candidatus Omnitrophota bacterium]MBD3268990.1 prepilin-type N-terminal cleavage/methylation domain-containing protein [Candidatus Omnitrophota bacterium]
MRKGFTLIELIVVVVIVGILATLALPIYIKSVKRAKEGKAKHHLGLITQAEDLYRNVYDTYLVIGDAPSINALNDYIDLGGIDLDTDWDYYTDNVTATTCTVHAVRTSDLNKDEEITIDQNKQWDDSR